MECNDEELFDLLFDECAKPTVDSSKCPSCAFQMSLYDTGYLCCKCGYTNFQGQLTSQYSENQYRKHKHVKYSRLAQFCSLIRHIEDRDQYEVKQEIVDECKNCSTLLEVRKVLKSLKLNKLYKYAPQILIRNNADLVYCLTCEQRLQMIQLLKIFENKIKSFRFLLIASLRQVGVPKKIISMIYEIQNKKKNNMYQRIFDDNLKEGNF